MQKTNRPQTSAWGQRALVGLVLAVSLSTPAAAGDFYAIGDFALSGLKGSASGTPTFSSDFRDSDIDSGPILGLAFGFGAALDYLIPWDPELPSWMPFDIEVPHWDFRSDIEALGTVDDYELTTKVVTATDADFETRVKSWTVLWNFYFDIPLRAPARQLFGRVPFFERASFDIGAGVGVGNTIVSTDNRIEGGRKEVYGVAYQASAALGYRIADSVKLSFGYRYRDSPDAKIRTRDAGQNTGRYNVKIASHEFTTQLRWEFYWLPWPAQRVEPKRFSLE